MDNTDGFVEYINRVRTTFNIPGVAVGILQISSEQSKTFLKGYGNLNDGPESAPVDERYGIRSEITLKC